MMSLYQRCSAALRSVTAEASVCSELIVMPDLSFVFLLDTSQDGTLRSLWDGHGQQRRAGVHAALAVSQQSSVSVSSTSTPTAYSESTGNLTHLSSDCLNMNSTPWLERLVI